MFRSVSISRLRGYYKLTIGDLDRFNLILGRNNVGKTALLEAIYLLVGPTNPELPLRINGFRGIEQVRAEPEEMWGWLFYQKDFTRPIELEAVNDRGQTRSLRLSLVPPKTVRLTPANKMKGKARRFELSAAGGTASPFDLLMAYTSETGQRVRTRASIRDSGLSVDRDKQLEFPMSIFMLSRGGYSAENAERYSKLEEVGKAGDLLPPLQQLEPRLKRLAILVTGAGPIVHGDIGVGRLVPLPLMGEGVSKLLTLLLAIATAEHGVVMVDDIDTGFHYSALVNVWTAVATLARSYDVQLVATSHSWECFRAAHEAFSASGSYDFMLHRLGRRDSQVESVSYDKESIELALSSGMELR